MRGGLDRSPFPSAVEKLLNPCAVAKHGPERWRQGLSGARCFRGLWLTGGFRALQQYYKILHYAVSLLAVLVVRGPSSATPPLAPPPSRYEESVSAMDMG